MRNIFNYLLAVLCLADLTFILSNLILAPASLGSKMNEIVFKTAQCFCQVSLTFSIFMTLALTIDRYQVAPCLDDIVKCNSYSI